MKVVDLDVAPTFFAYDRGEIVRPGQLLASFPVSASMRGAFAGHADVGGTHRFVRDPLGVQKLFWAQPSANELHCSSSLAPLTRAGFGLDVIFAVPPGAGMAKPDGTPRTQAITPKDLRGEPSTTSLEAIADGARNAMEDYLAKLAPHVADAPVYVCMSGGIDSSGIAVLAKRRLPGAIGVSFDLQWGDHVSEDRVIARRLAADLGLPLIELTPSIDEMLAHLDAVIVDGIDFRDFNVHAALVNAVLGAGIRAHAGRPAYVLTGDLANELLADYHEEEYAGQTYYKLPRLRGTALRDVLVRGSETSHRELGVFAGHGLTLIQPYAVAVDQYMALDDAQLETPSLKRALAARTFGEQMPAYVLDRTKSRAQVGDAQTGHGTMSACIDRGIDAAYLRERFAVLHGIPNDKRIDHFFRAGRYACGLPRMEA